MKRFLKWIAIILSIFFIMILGLYFFISMLLDTEPPVKSNSYISMQLYGSIPEYSIPNAIEDHLGGISIDLKKIRQNFKMAEVDDRIQGIILEISSLQIGFAKLHELHQHILNFRKSGKKVFAYLEFASIRDYYLATACDSIFMPEGGDLFLTGLSAEVTFYKGFFNKIGVEADFEHAGKYKNAPDVYTEQTMSNAHRKVINEILDARYDDIINTISKYRQIPKEKIETLINNISGFYPKLAIEQKLIDGIKYLDELPDYLNKRDREISKISMADYSIIDPSGLGIENGPHIAVIYCTGTIVSGDDGTSPYFGSLLGASRVIRNINTAAENKSIKAIILRIDSPGGSMLASDNIWYAIVKAREKKPVIASISDLGASGGYYIAMAADTVIAQASSLIGSIGVYAGKFSLEKLYKKLDLNNVIIRRGENAGLFSLQSKFTDSERKIIKNMINDSYKTFIEKVSAHRNMTFNDVSKIAEGRVWTADTGIDIKLIDKIGGLDKAIQIAKRMANIKSDQNIRLLYFPKSKSFWNQLFSYISINSFNLLNPFNNLEYFLAGIQNKPLFLMPFTINFK